MQFQTSRFVAWQEAERRACAAERELYARVLARDSGDIPTPDEVAEVQALRASASGRMKDMLDEMRILAASLRCSPGQPLPHERAASAQPEAARR